MPQLLGEVALLTLFADVHYYFSPSTAKPPHHRFEKGSYVYLFHHREQRRGRVEIANNAGTPEQDAFAGSLDNVLLRYSYRHPTLFTIVVDGPGGGTYGGPIPVGPDSTRQWHLPAPDPRNEGHYVFKLYEVDIYFWTMEDASTFLDSAKKVLPDHQIRIQDAPAAANHSEHRDIMSPLVQQLEQIAVTKPFQGRRSNSQTTNSTNQSSVAPSMTPGTTASSPPAESQQSFAPMAYNPAAPAAPEPIAHREKTPPPLDGEAGTGLMIAAQQDQAPMYATHGFPNPYQQQTPTQQQGYFSGPPQRQTSTSSMPPPPPLNGHTPPSHLQRTGTFPPPPPSASTSQVSTPQGYPYSPSHITSPPPQQDPNQMYNNQYMPQRATSQTSQTSYNSGYSNYNPGQQYQQPQPQSQGTNYQVSPPLHQSPAPSTPGMPMPNYSQTPTQGQYPSMSSPGIPQGGYSQYSYSQQPGSQIQPDNVYSIHQQAYRPTQAEAGAHAQVQLNQPGPPSGKFDQRMDKVEKGVGKFLKKLDKKL
ncbi:MAG: hypothetical protein M1820_005890 [Bogoriella megaspora]|nr:MAG: hypothetical protein M1820_005890 [Bogoriella megaspora]